MPPTEQGHTFTLYNLLGERLLVTELNGSTTTLDIDFAPGIYLYQIASLGTAQNGKLLVE